MEAFVKSSAAYRTIKQATVISSALVIDSLEADSTSVTVRGTGIRRSDIGNWLIIDGMVYVITAVKPKTDQTVLTLSNPIDCFDRSLEIPPQVDNESVGGFVRDMMISHWVQCDDPLYSMPYLTVSNSDTTMFIPPELDDSGCFELSSYCRLMRKSYRILTRFADAGDRLVCSISKVPAVSRQVSFEDGRSTLQSVNYASAGTAKITVLRNVDTGEKDENGEAIFQRERSTWYLAEDGSVSQDIPARRASGKWVKIYVKESVDVQTKVIETFAKSKSDHKLEFWSTLDLAVQDDCTFFVHGELLQSYISYKQKSSGDNRFYYKSGELATTATEKLRGVRK